MFSIIINKETIYFRRCVFIKELQINEKIRDKEVRVISSEGEQLGVMPTRDALRLAEEDKLDLVCISPNAKPAVCKIMSYSKFKYETEKKAKESKKKQKVVNLKEIRMTPKTEQHDLEVKVNNAIKFLKAGNKVKVSVRFRGREIGYSDLGRKVLDKFAEMSADYSVIEKKPKLEGRNMTMFLGPKKE